MTQIVNNDKLIFVITAKGLQRIADVHNPHKPDIKSIDITNVRVGDANGEYYIPSDADEQIDLRNPIPNGKFPVLEKSLIDDITVSFRFIIPEEFDDCDIREIALYMNVDGQEVPFAIGVQQPLVKPSILDDYFISVDYYIYLRSENLAEEYDKIYLDPENQLATETDIEDLISTILWSQTNLMEQVGSNSKTIGLDRAAQLQQLISNDENNISNAITYGNFTNLLFYTNQSNIFSYWSFGQTKITTNKASITDFGPNGANLSTNTNLEAFDAKLIGMSPSLKINPDNYFYLDKSYPLVLLNESKTEDIDFTMAFAIEPLSDYTGTGRILLARSNQATANKVFEIWETSGNALTVCLYTNSSNYLKFTSVVKAVPKTAHSIVLTYDHTAKTIKAFINGLEVTMVKEEVGTYTHMNATPTTLYAYSVNPTYKIYSDSPTEPTTLFGADGAPNLNSDFYIEDNKVYFQSTECTYNSSDNINRPKLYAYAYGSSRIYIKDTVITQNTVLYNADYTRNTSEDFKVIPLEGTYVIQFSGFTMSRAVYYDIDPSIIYAWEYEGSALVIWANRSSSPTILYNSDGNLYQGDDWTIQSGIVTYNNSSQATYTPAYNRSVSFLETTPYIVNNLGEKINFTQSYVSVISVLKTKLSAEQAKTLSISLAASLGVNPCIIVSG